MTQHAVRLTDLIERGRVATRAKSEAVNSAYVQGSLPSPIPAASARGSRFIARELGYLAEELMLISNTPSDDPQALLRAALRSIEACLMAVQRHP